MAISTRHPAARSPFASRCRVARASATRLLLMLAIPDAAVFRMSEGSSGFDGSDIRGAAVTSNIRPPSGGWRRVASSTARVDCSEPSTPMTIVFTLRTARRTTSTEHGAARTTSRDTLPASRRRTAPCPRQPITITSARARLAARTIAAVGGPSAIRTRTSDHRPARALVVLSAVDRTTGSSALFRVYQSLFVPGSRATTPEARVPAGHGKHFAVTVAAVADNDPSDATSTRNPLTRAMESSPRAQRQTRSNHVTATIMPVEQDPNPPKRLSGGYQHEHRAEYLAAIARVSPPVRIPGAPPSSSNFFSKIGRWGDCEAPRRAGSSCFGRAARPAERGMG